MIFIRPPDQMISYLYDEVHSNIAEDDAIFLYRWWIVKRAKAKRFRFNIYLHRFVRSDEDRALHDHPWWSISILLKGLIWEIYQDQQGNHSANYNIRRFIPLFRPATHAHRIILESKDAWTLFITGPKIREWGFWCPQGWRHWKDFAFGQGCK